MVKMKTEDKVKPSFVSCPSCGRNLFESHGESHIDIRCPNCRKIIICDVTDVYTYTMAIDEDAYKEYMALWKTE